MYKPISNYKEFLDKLMSDIDTLGIDVSNYYLDHFGYQSSSKDDYENLKLEFQKIGTLISEKIVGGRRVGIFKLIDPIIYRDKEIPAIELIEPKDGQICPSGLEHVEFVIDTDFENFVKKYKDLEFDTSKTDQPVFPMVTLKLSNNTQVKFHLKPVLDIVSNNNG